MRTLLRARTFVALAAIAAVVAVAGIAWAFWTTTGTGTASASTATLDAPTNAATAYTAGSGTVSVSWTGSTLSTGAAAQGYYVTRYSGSTPAAACGTSPTSLATGSPCNDASVPDGTYHYVVTAVYHSWSAASEPSGNVIVTNDVTRPTVTINQASGQADPTNTSPVNFTVVFSESVTGFSAAGVTLGGTAGATTKVVTGSGATYNVAVSGMAGTGSVTASVTANAAHDTTGNLSFASTSTDNTVSYDVTAPTAPAPGATAAVTFGSFINHESVTLTDAATDAGSGVASVSYYYCAGATGSCTSGDALAATSTTSAGNFSVSTAVWTTAADGPYRIVAVATDNAGNVSAPSAITVITVDATPPTVPVPTVNGHS